MRPTTGHQYSIRRHRGNGITRRQCGDRRQQRDDGWVSGNQERGGAGLQYLAERDVELGASTSIHDVKPDPERARRIPDLPHLRFRSRAARVHQIGDHGRVRHNLVQQRETFGVGCDTHTADAGYIAARSIHAWATRPSSQPDHRRSETRWNRGGSDLCGAAWFRGANGRYDADVAANEIGRQSRQSIIFSVRPSICDRHIASIHIASLREPPIERIHLRFVDAAGAGREISDSRDCAFRAGDQRPPDRAAK